MTGASWLMVWSIISVRRRWSGRCRWRAAPTAPRAFPGPRSPCGPCQARPPAARPAAQPDVVSFDGVDWRPARRRTQRRQGAPVALLAPLGEQRCIQPLPAKQRALAFTAEPLVLGQDPQLVRRRILPAHGPLGDLRIRIVHPVSIGDGHRHREAPSPPSRLNDSLLRLSHPRLTQREGWIRTWNANPRPFTWVKTADDILNSLAD